MPQDAPRLLAIAPETAGSWANTAAAHYTVGLRGEVFLWLLTLIASSISTYPYRLPVIEEWTRRGKLYDGGLRIQQSLPSDVAVRDLIWRPGTTGGMMPVRAVHTWGRKTAVRTVNDIRPARPPGCCRKGRPCTYEGRDAAGKGSRAVFGKYVRNEDRHRDAAGRGLRRCLTYHERMRRSWAQHVRKNTVRVVELKAHVADAA
jgi:hypothetical protein